MFWGLDSAGVASKAGEEVAKPRAAARREELATGLAAPRRDRLSGAAIMM